MRPAAGAVAPSTTPRDDPVRARLLFLGVPADMLERQGLWRIVADSTGIEPPHHLTADQLAQIIISLADRARLKLPKFSR